MVHDISNEGSLPVFSNDHTNENESERQAEEADRMRKNNLDPACHNRNARICLLGGSYYALDLGAKGHAYKNELHNGWQKLTLVKVDENDRYSPWLIRCDDLWKEPRIDYHFEFCASEDGVVKNVVSSRRVGSDEKKQQEWYIGRWEGNNGFSIINARFKTALEVVEPEADNYNSHKLISATPDVNSVGQRFQIMIT